MVKWLVFGLVAMGLLIGGLVVLKNGQKVRQINVPIGLKEKPLDKYTIENLGKREYKSEILLDDAIATTSAFTVYKFHYDSDGKKVTGLAHVPGKCPCPVIVQFRGYVERSIYEPGVGTQHSAEVFAKSGFISLAPDFLGYGGSDMPPNDVFEERFLTYVAALNLISATENWKLSTGQLGLWGHSNGGQIALSVLEISQKDYPTVLWAPVSKPFPYSILYYTDEAEDWGKALRKKTAEFEKDYDVFQYDLTRYLGRIAAPMQIHQGTMDESVSAKWSEDLVKELKIENSKLKISYFEYQGANHNLTPGWSLAVERSEAFFARNFGD